MTSIDGDYDEKDRIDERENDKENRVNRRVVTSTRLVGKKSTVNSLPFNDVVVKEERREFVIEKMDFAKGEHLQPG